MVVTRHAGRWTLEDRFASAWHYLPVEVPRRQLRAAGGAGVRAVRRHHGPRLPGPGRLPRLVRRRAPVVRHHRRRGDARLPARRAGAGHLAGDDRPAPGAAGRRRLHASPSRSRTGRASWSPTRPPEDLPPLTDRPPRRDLPAAAGPPLAGRRPAHPHRALRRGDDGARAGQVRGRPGPGLPRGHRPQHDQPPRRAGRGRGRARHHAAARPGGHHRGRATPTRSATSAGSTSASRPTTGWTPPSRRAACCR